MCSVNPEIARPGFWIRELTTRRSRPPCPARSSSRRSKSRSFRSVSTLMESIQIQSITAPLSPRGNAPVLIRRAVLLALVLAGCAAAQKNPSSADPPPQPPVARKVPHVAQINGDTLHDDYFWLRNKGTAEVESYLRAAAAYADAMMKPTAALQKTVYDELLSRIQEDDSTPPVRIGTSWYYQRTEKG